MMHCMLYIAFGLRKGLTSENCESMNTVGNIDFQWTWMPRDSSVALASPGYRPLGTNL